MHEINSKMVCFLVSWAALFIDGGGVKISTLLGINLDFKPPNFDIVVAKLLDCSLLLTIKMVEFQHVIFMKVEALDLILNTKPEPPHFNIFISSYGQISEQRSVWNIFTFSTSKQNLKPLKGELGFGFNIKVVELFLAFHLYKERPNPTSRVPDIA